MPKKVLCAFPPKMIETVDRIAAIEHRTRSDLIREAIRRYIDNFNRANTVPITPTQLRPDGYQQ